MSEVSAVSGEAGNYSVTLKTHPRYVNDNCTACGECEKAVESEFDNEYDYGMKQAQGRLPAVQHGLPAALCH